MSPRVRRVWIGIGGAALFLVAILVGDYLITASRATALAQTVRDCGGTMGSIPAWPVGTDYRIRFDRPLTESELDRLRGLNSLRGIVNIAFVGCELTPEQVSRTRQALPRCRLFKVVHHESVPLLTE